MGINKNKGKDGCFNILLIKTYYKLRNYIFLKTQSSETTNKILYHTFNSIYITELNEIPFKKLEKKLYKIASECIKRGYKESAV